jgi:mannobiose 2-epimerase
LLNRCRRGNLRLPHTRRFAAHGEKLRFSRGGSVYIHQHHPHKGDPPMLSSVKNELISHILPFWNSLRDDENGGFYGFMDSDLQLDKAADKGGILHARILWFYSNCYLALRKPELLENARHAYQFLIDHCLDKNCGGIYWLVGADGKPIDDMKHIYCQAFFVYALSSYYDASGDESALQLALDTFHLIESKGRDDVAYKEALLHDWSGEVANEALSENGLHADKTMNTILHLIEAYTELCRVTGGQNEAVGERLLWLLQLTYEKIFDKENDKLFVFFDKNMDVIGDIHSYGHDIEATWLIDRAMDILHMDRETDDLAKRLTDMNRRIVKNLHGIALNHIDGYLNNERDGAHVDTKRVWWVQAEAVVGFANAHQRHYGEDDSYLAAARQVWDYIAEHIVDKRPGGEWHSQIEADGGAGEKPVVEPWKCPYHNGRMCLEILSRGIS